MLTSQYVITGTYNNTNRFLVISITVSHQPFLSNNSATCNTYKYIKVIKCMVPIRITICLHPDIGRDVEHCWWSALYHFRVPYHGIEMSKYASYYLLIIPKILCKIAVSPLLKHWRYCSLALTLRWRHNERDLTGEFPSQRPVTRSFDVFFDLCLNKRLSK